MTEADVGEKVVEKNRLKKAYLQKTHRAVVVMVSYLLSKLCVFEMFSFFAWLKVSELITFSVFTRIGDCEAIKVLFNSI